MQHFVGVLALACAFFALAPQGVDHQLPQRNYEFKIIYATPGVDLSVCKQSLTIPGVHHRRERLISGAQG